MLVSFCQRCVVGALLFLTVWGCQGAKTLPQDRSGGTGGAYPAKSPEEQEAGAAESPGPRADPQAQDGSSRATSATADGGEVEGLGESCGEEVAAAVCKIEQAIFEATNRFRAEQGLRSFERQPELSVVSRAWSRVQADRGEVGHEFGFGGGRWTSARQEIFREEFGRVFPFANLSENVGYSSRYGLSRPEAVAQHLLKMWKRSDGHRQNLLGNQSLLGIGVATADSSIYVTQIFANP